VRKVLATVTSAVVAIVAIGLVVNVSSDNNARAAVGPERVLVAVKAKQHRKKLRRARAATQAQKRARKEAAQGSVASPVLQAIAACESGGNPRAIGGGGTFRGKYQFTYATWAGVGGSGDPAAAPEAEQDRRAAMLLARSGRGQWPVCGR
jgi:Transglycosylase-like domain